jgi:two-component system, cell cycle response regulator DivK
VTQQHARKDDRDPPAHRAPPSRVAVLIVDDNSDTRELYALYLASRGFTVFVALDGLSGIEAARTRRPDVIVMDLSMPGVDGITATHRLKRDPLTCGTPILILTGYPQRAIQGGALEAGADGFLTKPCFPEDLEHHVLELYAAARERSA